MLLVFTISSIKVNLDTISINWKNGKIIGNIDSIFGIEHLDFGISLEIIILKSIDNFHVEDKVHRIDNFLLDLKGFVEVRFWRIVEDVNAQVRYVVQVKVDSILNNFDKDKVEDIVDLCIKKVVNSKKQVIEGIQNLMIQDNIDVGIEVDL